jgi:CRISPR-associated protein Csy2
MPDFNGLLVVPHLRVQNANAISSPLTWGFPALTAFLGLMWALERKTFADCRLTFHRVGVISHYFAPLVTQGGYTRAFRLTRNPVNKGGETDPIMEEGRAHLEISLIFAVSVEDDQQSQERRKLLAGSVKNVLANLRVAGGTILPSRSGLAPFIEILAAPEGQNRQLREIRHKAKLVPGFALVGRPDLLSARRQDLAQAGEDHTILDAWLDLNGLNWRAERTNDEEGEPQIVWKNIRRKKGWIVPVPIGYAALTGLYEGGQVKQARDRTTPFRFVESLYSFGEWLGVHRLRSVDDLLWYGHYDEPGGLYLARNDYKPPSQEI